jgi:predicted phosphoribosyltransferase
LAIFFIGSMRDRMTGSKVRFITRRAGIVGGQKTGRTVAVMQLAQIRGVVLNLPFGLAPRSLLARKFGRVSDMICVNPIALLGETACASPALSTCIIARIQDAGMLHRCDASAMNAANESPAERLRRDRHQIGGKQRRSHQAGKALRAVDNDGVGVAGEFWPLRVQHIAGKADAAKQPWPALLQGLRSDLSAEP